MPLTISKKFLYGDVRLNVWIRFSLIRKKNDFFRPLKVQVTSSLTWWFDFNNIVMWEPVKHLGIELRTTNMWFKQTYGYNGVSLVLVVFQRYVFMLFVRFVWTSEIGLSHKKRVWMGGYKYHLSVKILAVYQLSVKWLWIIKLAS